MTQRNWEGKDSGRVFVAINNWSNTQTLEDFLNAKKADTSKWII